MSLLTIFFQKNKLNSILKVLIALFTGGVSYLISDELNILFNDAILNNQMTVFSTHLIRVILFFATLFLLGLLSNIMSNLIHWRGSKNTVVYSVRKLLKADYDFFMKKPPSAIWTEINMSAQQTAGFYASFVELSSYLIEFLVYGFIIIRINTYAALFSVCIIPLSFLLTLWMQKKLSSWRMRVMDASKSSSVIALETITGIKDVKVKNAYSFFTQKLEQTQSKLAKTIVISSFYETYWTSITTLISSIAPLIVIYLLMRITNIATTKPGDIIILYSFIPLFLSSFKRIYSIVLTYFSAHPFIQTSKSYCQLEEEISGSRRVENFESLETRGCSVTHDNGQVVNIPDITIHKGEKVLIMGESGIGKSTLFNILLGLIRNFSGAVTLNDIPIREIDIKQFREITGISFQGSGVFSLSLKENILLGEKGSLDFDHIIDITQLKRQLQDKGEGILNVNSLSGGEKSRISLAQNLIRDPQLILIDESLSSVDETMEATIISKVVSEFKNSTIVCISHRKRSAEYFNRVINF